MKLNYVSMGNGPRTLVLLHGFPLDHAMWDGAAARLSSTMQVIVPDLRGLGISPAPRDGYEMEEHARDVVELLDSCGVDGPIVLAGLSMGGYVALAFAEAHSHRLSGLILCDTRATADMADAAASRETLAATVERQNSTAPVIEGMLPKLLATDRYASDPATVDRLRAMMQRQRVAGVAGCLRGMAKRPDRRSLLPRLAMPALVVVGSDDRITPISDAKEMANRLPNAVLHEIAGAGHMAPLEEPEAFARIVHEFVSNRVGHG